MALYYLILAVIDVHQPIMLYGSENRRYPVNGNQRVIVSHPFGNLVQAVIYRLDHTSATYHDGDHLNPSTHRKNAPNEYDAAQTTHARAYNAMNVIPQEEEEEEKVR
eukprot:99688_1